MLEIKLTAILGIVEGNSRLHFIIEKFTSIIFFIVYFLEML